MKWVLVAVAAVLGAAVTWLLTANRDADRPERGLPRLAEAQDGDDSSGFGGTPTPPSEVIGPAEAWMRDAEDEDALLANDETPEHPTGAASGVLPVRAASATGDVAGVGEPEAVAAVEAESEATAPTPEDEPAEGPSAGTDRT